MNRRYVLALSQEDSCTFATLFYQDQEVDFASKTFLSVKRKLKSSQKLRYFISSLVIRQKMPNFVAEFATLIAE